MSSLKRASDTHQTHHVLHESVPAEASALSHLRDWGQTNQPRSRSVLQLQSLTRALSVFGSFQQLSMCSRWRSGAGQCLKPASPHPTVRQTSHSLSSPCTQCWRHTSWSTRTNIPGSVYHTSWARCVCVDLLRSNNGTTALKSDYLLYYFILMGLNKRFLL